MADGESPAAVSAGGDDIKIAGVLTDPPPASRLEQVLFEALGEHAALLGHQMDRWFGAIQTRLDGLAAALACLASAGETLVAPPAPHADTAPSAAPAPTLPALRSSEIAAFDLRASWGDWRVVGPVEMLPGGGVLLHQAEGAPGVASGTIAVPPSNLLRVAVWGAPTPGDSPAVPWLRVVDGAGAALGPDVPLVDGQAACLLFAPHGTDTIRLLLFDPAPRPGARFALARAEVATVDQESHYEHARARLGVPVIAAMASSPATAPLLPDAVRSLLLQCDQVRVFLNHYAEVPDFLRHPRIEIRRSQDWDDVGDAGKFAWLGAGDAPGYRIIADDHLVFPPDFVAGMAAKLATYENRAILGLDGVLLKQPLSAEDDAAWPCLADVDVALADDRTCHLLGTGAMCFYSDMINLSAADIMQAGMAATLLARAAQLQRVPLITPARPGGWVRRGRLDDGSESARRDGGDGALARVAVLRRIAPLTMQPAGRRKIVCIMVAFAAEEFAALMRSWEKTRPAGFDWALIVVAAKDGAELRARVAAVRTLHELHVVEGEGTAAAQRLQLAFALAQRLAGDLVCIALDHARFETGDWVEATLASCAAVPPGAVFVLSAPQAASSTVLRQPPAMLLPGITIAGGDLLRRIAPPDTPARGAIETISHWIRCLAADNAVAAPLESLQEAAISGSVRVAVPLPRLTAGTDARPVTARPAATALRVPSVRINDFFEKVFVINPEEQQDRWEGMARRLARADIQAERIAGLDDANPALAAEYAAYLAQPLHPAVETARPVRSRQEFYRDYDSQAARVAYVEQRDRHKAITSAGAWAYLRSWERLLERILREQIGTALVLADDVMLHRRAGLYFAAATGELPADWLLLQLGTLQYDWTDDWIDWRSRMLYQTNGVAIGSFAVGIHFDSAVFLLDQVRRMQLPFDSGALAAATRAFPGRCFVTYPNIAIVPPRDGADIGASESERAGDAATIAATCRWVLDDYDA